MAEQQSRALLEVKAGVMEDQVMTLFDALPHLREQKKYESQV